MRRVAAGAIATQMVEFRAGRYGAMCQFVGQPVSKLANRLAITAAACSPYNDAAVAVRRQSAFPEMTAVSAHTNAGGQRVL
jgi:hypothetical protein